MVHVTLAPKSKGSCFGSSWDVANNGGRTINIILTQACLEPKEMFDGKTTRGGFPMPGSVGTLGLVLFDKMKKLEAAGKFGPFKVGQFTDPLNYLWAATVLHEIGHCVQQTINAAAYELSKKIMDTYANPKKDGDIEAQTRFKEMFSLGVTHYASVKPALMEVYPEIFAMLFMNVAVHRRLLEFFDLLGAPNVRPKALYPKNLIDIPDKLTDLVADAIYKEFFPVVTKKIKAVAVELATLDAKAAKTKRLMKKKALKRKRNLKKK